MKKWFVHTLIYSLAVFMVIFVGCGGEDSEKDQSNSGSQELLIGQWILETAPPEEGNAGALLSIEANSTWKYWSCADASQFIGPDFTGTWAIEGNVITGIESEEGESESAVFSVSETDLVLDYSGEENGHWEYVRQDEEAEAGGTGEINEEELEAMVNAALKSLQDSDSPDDIDEVEDSVAYLIDGDGESLIGNARKLGKESRMYPEVPASFECGTISQQTSISPPGLTYTFTFTGVPACVFNSGTVALNIPINGDKTVTYTNLVSEYCTLNGTVTVETEKTTDTVATTYTFESFNSCGHTLEGEYTITRNTETGEVVYAYGQHQGTYTVLGYSATVNADLDSNAEGDYTGTASISLSDHGTYTFSMSNVYLDPECGLPSSGTMSLAGSGGKTLLVSFENTTCDDPVATFSYGEYQHTINLTPLIPG